MMRYRLLVVVLLMVSTASEGQDLREAALPQEMVFVTKVDVKPQAPFVCDCYNSMDNFEEETECRCYGKDLIDIPETLNANLSKLTITDSDIKFIKKNGLRNYRQTLKDVTLGNLPLLRVIEEGTFADIPNLRTLYISHAPQLKFLHGLLMGITSRRFYSLRIVQTGLHEVPDLSYLPHENIMHLLDLDQNKIEKLGQNSVKLRAEQVTLNHNDLTIVENHAFNGSQIGKLNLRGNTRLTTLEPNTFKGLHSLRELDLSGTAIENLPVEGLQELEILKIEDTPSMKVIPSIYDLENLKVARLTHSFHCCAFKYPAQHNPQKHAEHAKKLRKTCEEQKLAPNMDTGQLGFHKIRKRYLQDFDPNQYNGLGYENVPVRIPLSAFSPNIEHSKGHPNKSDHSHLNPLVGRVIEHEEAKPIMNYHDEETFHAMSVEITKDTNVLVFCGNLTVTPLVQCYPEPNALNPCEDIMGFSWLRISVWFVLVLAMVGNLAVIIVVLCSGGELTVSRFLMCNLAFADFSMGLYLLLIASMDLHSVGSYFNFAFDWQYGLGCKLAGFLTVFASHLSIFTLTVVTLERWFAITYAINLTMRIHIGAAAKIMLGGWIYSIVVAALPLFGVSNYSSTSICLPMEVNRIADRAYLFSIILVNGVAFALIVFCYAQIYLSLGYETRHSTTKGEMTIAKKMALLIFTDFATWAPISFFSITALAGYPLIGVTKSKILLVFFYPINSCANPYLYAIMTAQYRRDFFLLLSRCGICKNRAHRYVISSSNSHYPVPLLVRANGNGQSHSVKVNTNDTYV